MNFTNKVYNRDNMEFMEHIPTRFFHWAIVDPVYGIDGNSHRRNKGRGKLAMGKKYPNDLWDQQKSPPEYFEELKRVSQNQIIFGANYFPSVCGAEFKTPRREQYDQFIKDHPTNWIIWDKVNGSTTFNDCELIYVSVPIQSNYFYFMWSGMMQGASMNNGTVMNAYKSKNQKRIHPTEKPIELYKYLINRFVKAGENLFDSHVGSGSIRIPAHQMHVNFWGTEISPTYFKDQEIRFNNYISQFALSFDEDL